MLKGVFLKSFLLGALIIFSSIRGVRALTLTPGEKIVNDFAGVISDERKAQLKEILGRVEAQTGVQIALVTVPSLSEVKTTPAELRSFVHTLFNQWGVGIKSMNNGVLILVAVKDRMIRFEFGSDYTEEECANLKKTFEKKILPFFSMSNYSDGVFATAMAAVQEVTVPVSFWEFHRKSVRMGFLFLVSLTLCLFGYARHQRGLTWGSFLLTGLFLFLLSKNLRAPSQITGFGGGSSSGTGITEKWTAG